MGTLAEAELPSLKQGPISEAVWKGALEDSLSGGSMPASTSLDLGAMRAAGKILDLPEEFTRSR